MKVLFLLTTFPLPGKPVTADKMYVDLIEEFVAEGHETYVATLLEKREGVDTCVHRVDGFTVLYVRCGNLFDVDPLEKGLTLLRLSRRFMAAIREFYGDIRFDLVVYPTPPITFAPVVRELKKEQDCRTYLILRDIFPQNARDLGMIKDPFTFQYFRRQERLLYRVSDHIGCMSQGNIDYVLRHNKVDRARLEILYNWDAPPSAAPPARGPDIREKYGLKGKFVAVFGGNIGYAQEMDFLLELAKLYRDRSDIVFFIVGRGVLRARIAKAVAEASLTNVVMHDFIPREDFDLLLRSCDIGLVNLDRRFTIPNIPSKTVAYFSASVPVLASIDARTDYGRMLDTAEAGLWSITGDLATYQRNFERLLNDPALRRRLGDNGRKAAREMFTLERAFRTITAHCRETIPGHSDARLKTTEPLPPARAYATKRLLDVVMASLTLVILSIPLLAIIAVLRYTGEGEVWFRQKRLGLNGKPFEVLKFATMRKDSERTGTRDITMKDDPRVLPVGRFLRRMKINELPQVVNVFRGEMSFVGWRPLMPKSFQYYPTHVQESIVSMKPGLTGIGSICFRDEEALTSRASKSPEHVYSEDIAPYKGELELWYQRNYSLWLDVKLVILTAWVVMRPGSRLHEKWLRNLPPRPASLDVMH